MNQYSGPSPIVSAAILLLAALLLYPVLALLADSPATVDGQRPRVLLIGLDGTDWIMLDHWFKLGELPNLAQLAETGLRGDLRTLRPIISPLVWTSIATGQTPDRHGVTDFYAGGNSDRSFQGVSRFSIRVPTLWDILSVRGRSVAVTAWWASWPADHSLNGRVVTDQVQFAFPGSSASCPLNPTPDDLFHPEELAGRLKSCQVTPGDLDDRALFAIAPGGPRDKAGLLRQCLAATTTYYRMTREMLRESQPDFAATYFMGTDTVAHLYGQATERDSYYQTLLRYYRLVDAMVGDLCSQVSPATLVVLVSDHGFYTGEDRPSSDSADFQHHAASWHRPLGMVLFSAPWIKPGRLDDASVLDVAPTLLWQLLGERFDSMPGRVLVENRMPEAADSAESYHIAVPGGAGEDNVPNEPAPDRYRELLLALGYLDGNQTDPAPAVRPTIHLADYLQWAGRPDEALKRLREAREQLGDNPELLARLALQQSRAGDQPGALESIGAALEQGWNPAAGNQLAVAVGICCAAGRPDRAEDLLNTLAPEWVQSASALTARAVLAEHRGRRQEAIDGYAAALEADPSSGQAAHSICRLLQAGDPRLAELCAVVCRAAGERTGDAPVQLNAGKLLLAAGDPEAARGPLGRAVHLEPDLADPRLLLGRALYQSGRPAEAFERLSRGLAWHPSHPQLLAAAGAAAIRAGYRATGAALLERATEAGASGPHLDAALALTR